MIRFPELGAIESHVPPGGEVTEACAVNTVPAGLELTVNVWTAGMLPPTCAAKVSDGELGLKPLGFAAPDTTRTTGT